MSVIVIMSLGMASFSLLTGKLSRLVEDGAEGNSRGLDGREIWKKAVSIMNSG